MTSAFAALSAAAGAGEAPRPCTLDNDWCVPLAGCIETTGEAFRGRSYGRNEGPVFATSSAGAQCKGTWRRTRLGVGIAEFACADGRAGRSVYTWFERQSGTAVGKGLLGGVQVEFWSGHNLPAYFAGKDPDEVQRMSCTTAEMLVG